MFVFENDYSLSQNELTPANFHFPLTCLKVFIPAAFEYIVPFLFAVYSSPLT